MMKRIGEKINKEIPISQAAYCKGRSTTEHVFACKILAEKAATSTNIEIHYRYVKSFRQYHKERTSKRSANNVQQQQDEFKMIQIMLGTS